MIIASTKIHLKISDKLLRAKTDFFKENKKGSILTRFSKDQATVDIFIFPLIMITANGFARTIAVMVTVCLIEPYVLIIFGVAIALMFLLLRYAIGHLREC